MTAGGRGSDANSDRNGPWAAFRALLLGSTRGRVGSRRLVGLAAVPFGVTFLGYELGAFSHGGGVVFVPFYAALVGAVAAFWAGYGRRGLVVGWLLAFLSLLGWRVEWATGISPRPLVARAAYVLRPDGLAVIAVMGAVVAVAGVAAGTSARRVVRALGVRLRSDADG